MDSGCSKYAIEFTMIINITSNLNFRLKVCMVHIQSKCILGSVISVDILNNVISHAMRHDLSHNFPALESKFQLL
jgi:hypothetical protein